MILKKAARSCLRQINKNKVHCQKKRSHTKCWKEMPTDENARSTYYYKPKGKHSGIELVPYIDQIHLGFDYSKYRWLTRQLQREDWVVNLKKAAQIMHNKG
jgi:hypothetical protein